MPAAGETAADDPKTPAASQTAAAAADEPVKDDKEHTPPAPRRMLRGPIERTIARMMADWVKAERNRGYLTPEMEDDAAQAIAQLEGSEVD